MDIRSIVDKNVIFKVLDLYVNKRFSKSKISAF